MDEFGVLTERYGLKSQKKSAPMAASKRQSTTTNNTHTRNFGSNSNQNPKSTWNPNSVNGSFVDNQDFLFPSSSNKNFDDYGDVFGDFQKGSTFTKQSSNHSSVNGFDYDSMFASSGSKSPLYNDNDDIFGLKKTNSVGNDDIFGSFSVSSVDELLGNFGAKSKGWSHNGSVKQPGFDDLIPGFGSISPNIGEKVKTAKSSFTSIEDPFVVLESTSTMANTSFTDPLEEISKLSGGKKPGSSSTFTTLIRPPPKPAQVLKADKVKSLSVKKATPAINMVDDLSFIFGAAPLFGEFEEVEGESEERRKARLERHQRTENRVAQAVADMNQRDRQTQHEQEERRRIADTLDFEIKRWAAGKEGNMRALLSSLQQVLWPECGWEPVSLTDLITSASVKKVYRKATLYVHPDKVQQKGATLQQKYIAEKVFDILKEAFNKFNSEELS